MYYSEKKFSSLVGERGFLIGPKTLFVTISPNPKALIKLPVKSLKTGKVRSVSRPYGMVPQRCQSTYCMNILQTEYFGLLDSYQVIGIQELNKQGNIHFHLLLNTDDVSSDIMLQCFRRDILNTPSAQANILGNKKVDWMNNIVFVNKPPEDILKYFDKDNEEMIKANFYNYFK